jgi:holo-ACP synthase CitX
MERDMLCGPPFVRAEIARVLSGRDERAFAQKFFLSARGVSYAAQISLNIPGLPKCVAEGEFALRAAVELFIEAVGDSPAVTAHLTNGAGQAVIMAFTGDVLRAKAAAVRIEDENEWGRAIDADIITADGPVTRASLGVEPRACLLCGEPAKICARLRRHDLGALRAEAARLLSMARP